MWSTHICRSAVHHPQRNQVFPSTAGVLLMVALVTITLKVHKYWRHCQMFPTIIPILKSVRLRCNEKKKGSPRFQICLFYVDIELLCHMKSFYPKEDLLKRGGYPKGNQGSLTVHLHICSAHQRRKQKISQTLCAHWRLGRMAVTG